MTSRFLLEVSEINPLEVYEGSGGTKSGIIEKLQICFPVVFYSHFFPKDSRESGNCHLQKVIATSVVDTACKDQVLNPRKRGNSCKSRVQGAGMQVPPAKNSV